MRVPRLVLFGLGRTTTVAREPSGRPLVLAGIGGALDVPTSPAVGMAAIGWTGRRRGTRERRATEDVAVWLEEGQRIGRSPASPVNAAVRVAGGSVSIEANDEVLVRSPAGAALAILNETGQVERLVTWTDDEELRLPVGPEVGSVARVTALPCRALVDDGWTWMPLTAPTRAVSLRGTTSATATVYIAAALAATAPAIIQPGRLPFLPSYEILDLAAPLDRERATQQLGARPGATLAALPGEARFLVQLQVPLNPTTSTEVALGRLDAAGVLARLDRKASGSLCVAGEGGSRAFEDRAVRFEVRWDDARLFGAGWHAAERDGAGWFRWTSENPARLLVSLARVGDVRVTVEASPAALGPLSDAWGLTVNDLPAGPPVEEERGTRTWLVPSRLWRKGYNVLDLAAPELVVPAAHADSADTRALGLAVRRVVLELAGGTGGGATGAASQR